MRGEGPIHSPLSIATSRLLGYLFDHPLALFLARKGEKLYLRDTLRLPALQQAQDRRRGFAPLHSPYFIGLPRTGCS